MSSTPPPRPDARPRGFRETLIRVLAVQVVALAALFLLQYCYHAG